MGWCAALLLASAADPLFAEVVHADAVVVGTVTAVAPELFETGDRPGNRNRWRAVAVNVHECWRGLERPGEQRFAYGEGADYIQFVKPFVPPVAPGRRYVMLLSGLADGLPVINYRPAPSPDSPASGQVRRACNVLNDPLGGLTAATPAARYFAAALLAEHYAMWRPASGYSFWGPPRHRYIFHGPPLVPIPADVSRLIVRAVAEQTDWYTPRPRLPRPLDLVERTSVGTPDDGLGLTVADGWTWPRPALPPEQTSRLVADLRELPALYVGLLRPLLNVLDQPLAPLPPLPQTPVQPYARVERIQQWLAPWYGWAVAQAVADADRVHLTRAAFDRWLDGPGERCVLRTTAGALRPPPAGGWGH